MGISSLIAKINEEPSLYNDIQGIINDIIEKVNYQTIQSAVSPFFKQKLPSKLINSDHYIFLTLNYQLLFCISLMHKRDAKVPFF